MSFNDTIRDFIMNGWGGGRFTHEIADRYCITNRQVGAKMGHLKRSGYIRTYTKGIIVMPGGLHSSKGAPTRLDNSFYEWIGD